MSDRSFVEHHFGDFIGLFLVITGTCIAFYALRLHPEQLAAFGAGLVNGGFLALKLRSRPNGNGPNGSSDSKVDNPPASK